MFMGNVGGVGVAIGRGGTRNARAGFLWLEITGLHFLIFSRDRVYDGKAAARSRHNDSNGTGQGLSVRSGMIDEEPCGYDLCVCRFSDSSSIQNRKFLPNSSWRLFTRRQEEEERGGRGPASSATWSVWSTAFILG